MSKKRLLYLLIGIKFTVALIAAWGYFTNPHIIRQIDTMATTLMYAKKFAHNLSLHNFLPTSLGAGDILSEVTPMEFPILNIILSPLFLIPWKYNYAIAHIFLILINYTLFWLIYRTLRQEQKWDLSSAWLLTPVYGLTLLYIDRFMPDATAFLLCSLSMFWMWKNEKEVLSILVGSLGMLIKPPVAVVYAVFLLLPVSRWKKLSICLLLSLIPVVFYYTLGMDYLKSHSQMDLYFAVDLRNPFKAVISFFSHPKKLFSLIFKDTLYRYSFVLILLGLFFAHLRKQVKDRNLMTKLLLVLFVQIILLAIINGDHSFMHNYYMIGTSFVACWLLSLSFRQDKRLLIVGLLFLVFTNLERSIYRTSPLRKGSIRSEARTLLEEVPELRSEKKIRTKFTPVPRLGLVFGKIQNSSSAKYGIYYKADKCDQVVAEAKTLKVCKF